ncbi:hypothetical protein DTL70_07220 [Streptomyces diacarni]|uniref:Uncharacterized protein n=1 Tax=Streptomyces diacarni TaxID=2800381 RepID=A0A367F7M4_9ACTN|nr:hypothetical protein [Streptomyces diacarni]RCG26368.1 hypothetical protein DTL70_07220 [Streptomyces diacarni]
MEQSEGGGAARPCEDCAWYRTMISRAAGDPRPRADLEALFGAHLHRNHAPEAPAEGHRRLRSV